MARRKLFLSSPFSFTTQRGRNTLRQLVTEAIAWEKAWNTDKMFVFSFSSSLVFGLSLTEITLAIDIENRSMKRVKRRLDFSEGFEAYKVVHMKKFNPRAYETEKLKVEVEQLREQVQELTAAK